MSSPPIKTGAGPRNVTSSKYVLTSAQAKNVDSRPPYPNSADESVSNYSNIRIVESKFNQNYKVRSIGIGTDYSFGFTLVGAAETNSYVPAGYSTGFYSTSSLTAIGGIHSTKIVNGGVNVKEFPAITSIGTTTGISAELEFGSALLILEVIIFFDLKKGPRNFPILPPIKLDNLSPKILKNKKKVTITINSKKYLIIFIFI